MIRTSGLGQRVLLRDARRAEQKLVTAMRKRDAAKALQARNDTEPTRSALRSAEQSVVSLSCNADDAWDKVWDAESSERARVVAAPDVIWWGHAPSDKELLVNHVLTKEMSVGVKYTEHAGTTHRARIISMVMRGKDADGTKRYVMWQTTRWEGDDGRSWTDVWASVWWGIARTSFEMRVEMEDVAEDIRTDEARAEQKQAAEKRAEKERAHWARFEESLGKEDEGLAKFLDALVRRAHYSYQTSGMYLDALRRKYPQCVWPGVERSAK